MDEMTAIEAYLNGREDAERDIAEGRLAIEIFVAPWSPDRGAGILKKRYGIETKIVGTDLVFAGEREHARGFNDVMEAEITRQFGPDVLEKAAAEAEANWKPPPPEPVWKTLLMLIGLPILLCAYCVLWLVIELPEELRARIERVQKPR